MSRAAHHHEWVFQTDKPGAAKAFDFALRRISSAASKRGPRLLVYQPHPPGASDRPARNLFRVSSG